MHRVVLIVTALALVLALLHGHVEATSGEDVDVTCPVCENVFRAWAWRSTNGFGGQDRDFLSHAAGGQVFLLVCWTCPRCLWTGLGEDYAAADFKPKDLDPDVVRRVREASPFTPREPIDPATAVTSTIPALVRWDLYMQRLTLMKAAPDALGWACLHAAQTQRFDHAWPEDLEPVRLQVVKTSWSNLPEEVRRRSFERDLALARALEARGLDEAQEPDEATRIVCLLAAADIWKQRGEDPDVERVLDVLAARHPVRDGAVRDAEAELRRRVAIERSYATRAMVHFGAFLVDESAEAPKLRVVRYLVGELERKHGDLGKAVAYLEALLARGDLPDWLEEWARESLVKSRSGR